ncbi:MAG: toll/interleukin-1 receptor domain-containing protein [Sphingopyxis sp.]
MTKQRDGAETGQRRFAAFISYSHQDSAMAARLHRRLEGYRLPGRLRRAAADAEGAGRGRGAANRLGAMFRDTADLAAATSLPDAIRAALANADALIILCSPAAARSQWVDAEIRLFRELHPNAPILPAIVAGDLTSALPPALVEDGREPLAADLRAEGDGFKLGFLKLVAALAVVPLDALIQRDAQRKLRRVIGVTLVTGGAMIAMGAMTLFAINARNEAQRQRAQAEGLIEYMLTDLRSQLRGVGRIDVMQAVNVRAMDYYADQGDVALLPDESLERRARVLLAWGEDDLAGGDDAAASGRFAQAHRATAALLARAPGDADAIFAHAQSEYWVGWAAAKLGNRAEYRQRMGNYVRLAERLETAEPGSTRALREVGYSRGNLCTLGINDQPAAPATARDCDAAVAAFRRVWRIKPTDPQAMLDLANRLNWNAERLSRVGDHRAALAHSVEALALSRQLHGADSSNRDWQDMLAASLLTTGQMHARVDEPAQADRLLSEAATMVALLRRHDPANSRWKFLAEKIDGARR